MDLLLDRNLKRFLLTILLFSSACQEDENHSHVDTGHIHTDAYLHGQLPDMTLTAAQVIALDDRNPSCTKVRTLPEMCSPAIADQMPNQGQQHIADQEIIYEIDPPSSGPHRPQWAKWGEYEYLPPQRWLHNLEHGGIAFLYHPCAPIDLIDQIKNFIKNYQTKDASPFRWVLTPYIDLPTSFAIVAWEWTLSGECLDEMQIQQFIERVYRKAPEDVAADGSFMNRWISK